ncbi:hypothetical protein LIER_17366 [Lithospermum erythrorhizon]|uniref:CASP-like protein n=1 Tax=Lithospermum erythrorhizon TaxID=34254 RepID=A0AAV3QDB8_LITER
MTNPDKVNSISPPPLAAVAAGDAEGQTPAQGVGESDVMRRWKREDFLKKTSFALRSLCLVFSLLAFIIMATNNHGNGREFDDYEEYRYVLAIAILSTLYTGFQTFRQFHEISTGRDIIPGRNIMMLDFFGDQIVAYLLLSAASSAVPLTNHMREGADNIFTDSAASSISMEFLAFTTSAISAMISGYKLSKQSYI